MKIYSGFLILLSITLISCSRPFPSNDSFGLWALLDYRLKVTIGGSFFGNFQANVKAVPLSSDGKCDRTLSGLGSSSTDDTGKFRVSYPRISQSGGYVCIVSFPKEDGSSRFFAVDQQKEFPWTGDAYNILILPEPSTTSRSQFNVVSTMFNRMATQKLEKLAEGNQDLSRTGKLLKSSNKQIVSQFGLSRGIGKSLSRNLSLQETFYRILYTQPRASSLEDKIPDLSDIQLDFSKKDDPVALKFTVIIGGIQSLADPNDPSSYDKVVGIISNVLSSGNKTESIVFPGGATLSAGGSFGSLVSEKVQSFVTTQGASLGLSPAEINTIKQEAVQLAAAIDNPPIGSAPEKPLYAVEPNLVKAGESFSVSPQVSGATGFQITQVCGDICENVSSTGDNSGVNFQFSSSTGKITGTVPANLPGDTSFQLRIKATKSGSVITGVVNFSFRGKPTLIYSGEYITSETNGSNFPSLYSIGPLPVNGSFAAAVSVIGANASLSVTNLPSGNCIQMNNTTGVLSGNFSCITSETSAQVTVTNDIGSNTYSLKFIPNSKPIVSNLSIVGEFYYSKSLTANYEFIDGNNHSDSGSTFIWSRCTDSSGSSCETISSATSKTYTVMGEDVGKYLKFQVTPRDNLGLAGDIEISNPVYIVNRAPSILSVSIPNSDTVKVGDTLSSLVSGYSDPDATPIGYYFYNWFNCSAETICNSTASGTASTYTISEADSGKFIKLYVNPVDSLGEMGTALNAIIYVKESTPPVVSDPQIYITAQSATSVSLKWNSATDNLTPASQLKYRIFYSTIASEVQQVTNTSSSFPNLQTAIVGSLANPIQLTGLSPETVHHFRVMAEDNDGNRTLYNTRSVLVSNNLMAYLPFDGDTANKSSVALTTTSYGSPVSTTGIYGTAYSFNGASAIAISNNASIKPISQLTLSLWVNANWFTNCRTSDIDGMISSTQSGGYSLGCKGELVEFYVFVGGYKSVGFNKKNLTGWNKLTGTYDGSNLKIYLNGILQSTLPLSGSISYNNSNSVQIGAEATDGASPDYSLSFTGLIDEVMIYNRALTEQEIKADVPSFAVITNQNSNSVGSTLQGNYLAASLTTPQFNWLRCDTSSGSNCTTINGATTTSYTLTTADTGKFIQFQVTLNETIKSQLVQIFNFSQDLVLYMPFNGNFNDESTSPMPQGRYNNANTSMPYLTTDRRGNFGSNAYFSDKTNYLVMANADKITSLGTNYTMSAWINLDAGIADHGIFSTWNANSGMIFRVYNYQIQNQNFTCPTTITPGQWVHVVGITEGTTAKIYFNGTLCNGGSGSVSDLPSDYANKWLLVGADYYPSAYSRALKGKMDDLRIYNRVLSATEVLSLYNYEK
jgi:hypothetical protein